MIHFFFLKAVILILCPLVDPNNKLACAALWFAIFIIVAALCVATIWLVERKGMKWAIGK
ncbi:hypothetical protein [Prevotella sp. AGR2160]|uniref:hypothetical protein n=1 Tax=Prevotella sp. AGR2160 TaxID=1280674 RepID=UPI0004299EDB|nr:hypothetical protein [Prevotella sp. AGR2160]